MDDKQEKIDYLKQKIDYLENKLEKLLSSQVYQNSTQAVQVTGALEKNSVKIIQVSLDQLVNIYNDVPKVLLEYSTRVSLTEESYRNKDKGLIFLEEAPRGNYWIITTQDAEENRHWLMPNGNVYFNIFQTQSLRYLFTVEGENFNNLSEFVLIKPAIVTLHPNGKEWKLETKGILHLGKIAPSSNSSFVSKVDDKQENSRVLDNDFFTLLKRIENETRNNSHKNWQLACKYDEQFKVQSQKYNNNLKTVNRKIKDIKSSQTKLNDVTKKIIGLGTAIAVTAAIVLYLENRQISQLITEVNQIDSKVEASNNFVQEAIALGNPLGLDNTVSAGIISAIGRSGSQLGVPDKRVQFIQTDAAINPGNFGGPLLNSRGEVIGINTAIRADAEGLGFAIPIKMAKHIADQLFTKGRADHPYLGISMINLSPETKESINNEGELDFKITEEQGVLLVDVLPSSPADQAGFKKGDIIIRIRDRSIENYLQVQEEVALSEVGKTLEVKIIRNGETKIIEVEPGIYPES